MGWRSVVYKGFRSNAVPCGGVWCDLVWRGAGGGRIPWSLAFLALLRAQDPGVPQPTQTLGFISRTASRPGQYSVFGNSPVTGVMGASGNVTLTWTAQSTQVPGLYALEVVQDPLVPVQYQSRNTSAVWELAVPFAFYIRLDAECVFDSSAGCGTGQQQRTVFCVNQTGTSRTPVGVWPPMDQLPIIPDRWGARLGFVSESACLRGGEGHVNR